MNKITELIAFGLGLGIGTNSRESSSRFGEGLTSRGISRETHDPYNQSRPRNHYNKTKASMGTKQENKAKLKISQKSKRANRKK